ncbi:MAG: DUF3276 family protein, partial [Bacteroidetes bacterium]|nr:DUF3276 family protein [Bacteroidota bacterium]
GDQTKYFRHKILLYKEDFNKILKGLEESIEFVKNDLMPNYDFDQFDREEAETNFAKELNS